MDGRQKINPLSLNYILLPFLILSDIRPVGSDLNTLSEKSNLSMEDWNKERKKGRKIGEI